MKPEVRLLLESLQNGTTPMPERYAMLVYQAEDEGFLEVDYSARPHTMRLTRKGETVIGPADTRSPQPTRLTVGAEAELAQVTRGMRPIHQAWHVAMLMRARASRDTGRGSVGATGHGLQREA
jgi:hypothetical protein